ncbi:MAG: DegT/DnrJ/EryC1/StrS family aminotransferase [Lachnospiraceae bacterium]|nr:DegT/DnrJ/EryC1/StrS family aminotransferase [Lachnospiraceae bacterium]
MAKMNDIKPFEKRLYLASPTMHGEELQFVKEAIETNWVSTVGENINRLEEMVAEYVGVKHAVALASGTSALHLSMKLAGGKLNPGAKPGQALKGMKVFCSDLTFDASVNPVLYEDGEPVFIDTERDTWNMDPAALEKAFEMYPDVKLVVLAHLYGVPAKMDEIVDICRRHKALIIEDAAEALGASYEGARVSGKCGTFGDYIAVSFNGNKIVTGSTGGMFLTNDGNDADKARKWSTQSREDAPWYQHEELGYNYRMSNIDAGIARGNMLHISEHIAQKKAIYERYREGLRALPVSVNPYDDRTEPNFWLTCMLIDEASMCKQVRGEKEYLYIKEKGKTCPHEILEALASINAEGRPIWKPMHMQPIYRTHGFVTCDGYGRARSNAYIDEGDIPDTGADIFNRGLCLPSDNKMTPDQQEKVIDTVRRCFE